MIHRYILLAVVITALTWPVLATGQISKSVDKSGMPASRTYYSPEDYSGYHQIWAITSDDLNRIYIGTAEGISVYDNSDWTLISTPSNTTVRSLDYGFQNEVYVGLQGDIGKISPDSSGSLRYNSLISENDGYIPDFGNVWETHATPGGVYFQSSHYIGYWNGRNIKWIASENGYHTSFKSASGIIVREKSVGLIEINNGVQKAISHSNTFSNKRVFVLEDIGPDEWLVGTRDNGFYRLTKGGVLKIKTDIDNLVVDNWIYGAIRLTDNIIGVYTLGAGFLALDIEGHLVRSISMPTEISDRYIISAHLDKAGSIWLGTMNSGIERYNTNILTTSVYDESLGVDGYVYDIQAKSNKIVVSTGSGLHILESSETGHEIRNYQHFKKIDSVPIAWESSIVGKSVYAVSDAGVFRIREESIDTLSTKQSFSIATETGISDILFIGGKGEINIISINTTDNAISHILTIPVDGEVDHIEWDSANRQIWANIKNTKIETFTLDPSYRNISYRWQQGYPASDSEVMSIFEFSNNKYYATSKKIYQYYPRKEEFILDEMCAYLCSDEIMAIDIADDEQIWVVYSDSVVSGKVVGSSYDWKTHSDLRFHRTSTGAIKYGDDNVLYIGDRSRIFRYDTKIQSINPKYDYSVLIKEIKPARTDSVYKGVYTDGYGGIGSIQPTYAIPLVMYEQRDIDFTVTTTNYNHYDGIKMQYRYDGENDITWKDIHDNMFTVSPSREGEYSVVIRAIDEVGRSSRIGKYRFVVLPPWYRTWWSYIGYTLLVVLGILVTKKYINLRQAQKQAEEQAKELERERIVVRKLQEANERLVEANKLKDEFLATTSHELRTPLTAILGFTSVLKEEIPADADYREFLDIISDSGGRLMETLNSLLDLAKIRSGLMELSIEMVDIIEIAQNTMSSYSERAETKGLYLRFESLGRPAFVKADSYGLERVISNLVSNAIKFTDTGGVTIKIKSAGKRTTLSVSDTGVGIEESFIPRLFNAFMQESDGLSRAYEGSGLGLAITGRLVKMMDATLSVDSKKGVGSTFTVSFEENGSKIYRTGNIGSSATKYQAMKLQ